MVHEIKNRKTKLPLLGIIINFVVRIAGLAAVIGLFYVCDATVSTVLGVYLGYRVLRLVMRLFGLLISAVFTAVFITFLVIIILILIL